MLLIRLLAEVGMHGKGEGGDKGQRVRMEFSLSLCYIYIPFPYKSTFTGLMLKVVRISSVKKETRF